jgi:hypothetical protein
VAVFVKRERKKNKETNDVYNLLRRRSSPFNFHSFVFVQSDFFSWEEEDFNVVGLHTHAQWMVRKNDTLGQEKRRTK